MAAMEREELKNALRLGPGEVEAVANRHVASATADQTAAIKACIDAAVEQVLGRHCSAQGAGSMYKGTAVRGSDIDVIVRFTQGRAPATRSERKLLATKAVELLHQRGLHYDSRLGESRVHLTEAQPYGADLPSVDIVLEYYGSQQRREPPDPAHLQELRQNPGARMALRVLKLATHAYALPSLPAMASEYAALVVAARCRQQLGQDNLAALLPELLHAIAQRNAPPLPVEQAWAGVARSLLAEVRRGPRAMAQPNGTMSRGWVFAA